MPECWVFDKEEYFVGEEDEEGVYEGVMWYIASTNYYKLTVTERVGRREDCLRCKLFRRGM
jgi:hypothetical protein